MQQRLVSELTLDSIALAGILVGNVVLGSGMVALFVSLTVIRLREYNDRYRPSWPFCIARDYGGFSCTSRVAVKVLIWSLIGILVGIGMSGCCQIVRKHWLRPTRVPVEVEV